MSDESIIADRSTMEADSENSSQENVNSSSNNQKNKAKCTMNTCQKILYYGIGSVLLIFGLVISGFWWHAYEQFVISKLILTNDSSSESYQTWSDSDAIPLYFNIYMFNWTNAEASLKLGDKPCFQETGPYVYRLRQFKENITWNSNDTITYFNRQLWNFMPELSKGCEYDIITSPNIVLLSIFRTVDNFPELLKLLKIPIDVFLKLNKINMYVTKTAKELLFEGYDDKLLDIMRVFKKVRPRMAVPDRFAWYLPKNQSIPDVYNMFTGHSTFTNLGFLHAWNYTKHRSAFDGKCGDVTGSPGDLWPLDISSRQNASLYISDFCSNFVLENVGASEVNGIDGVTFEAKKSMFDNGTDYPQYQCYCPNSKCQLKSGLRNMTTCVQAPVFVSHPHFHLADDSYREAIDGMQPDAEKHKFYLIVQKDFGVVLKGAARLQLNVHVEPILGLSVFGKLGNVMIPALWFEEDIKLPENIVDKLHTSFTMIPIILTLLGLFLVIAGSILLVAGLLITRLTFQTIPYVHEDL